VRLLIEPYNRQLVGLNNNSSKLKKLPKEARRDLLRQLLRQAQKREQLRSLKIVVRSYKLQQAYYYLNHDTAEQLSSQPNIDSCIYVSMPVELNSKKHCDHSYRTWLNSFMLGLILVIRLMVTPSASVKQHHDRRLSEVETPPKATAKGPPKRTHFHCYIHLQRDETEGRSLLVPF
jgi:hypothetical protein